MAQRTIFNSPDFSVSNVMLIHSTRDGVPSLLMSSESNDIPVRWHPVSGMNTVIYPIAQWRSSQDNNKGDLKVSRNDLYDFLIVTNLNSFTRISFYHNG